MGLEASHFIAEISTGMHSINILKEFERYIPRCSACSFRALWRCWTCRVHLTSSDKLTQWNLYSKQETVKAYTGTVKVSPVARFPKAAWLSVFEESTIQLLDCPGSEYAFLLVIKRKGVTCIHCIQSEQSSTIEHNGDVTNSCSENIGKNMKQMISQPYLQKRISPISRNLGASASSHQAQLCDQFFSSSARVVWIQNR